MAAFGILYDVAKHHGLLREGDPLISFLSHRGRAKFRELANFLKHADKDPSAAYTEPPIAEHEYRIGFALLLYRRLVGDLTPEMGAFHLTMLTTHPEHFRVAPDPDPAIEEGAQYSAEPCRKSWERRRLMANVYLDCIKRGVLPANVNLKRT